MFFVSAKPITRISFESSLLINISRTLWFFPWMPSQLNNQNLHSGNRWKRGQHVKHIGIRLRYGTLILNDVQSSRLYNGIIYICTFLLFFFKEIFPPLFNIIFTLLCRAGWDFLLRKIVSLHGTYLDWMDGNIYFVYCFLSTFHVSSLPAFISPFLTSFVRLIFPSLSKLLLQFHFSSSVSVSLLLLKLGIVFFVLPSLYSYLPVLFFCSAIHYSVQLIFIVILFVYYSYWFFILCLILYFCISFIYSSILQNFIHVFAFCSFFILYSHHTHVFLFVFNYFSFNLFEYFLHLFFIFILLSIIFVTVYLIFSFVLFSVMYILSSFCLNHYSFIPR